METVLRDTPSAVAIVCSVGRRWSLTPVSLRNRVALSESIQHTVDMAAVSIQNEIRTDFRERLVRWQHVADTFGLPLTAGQLEELRELDDRAAARRFLPHLSDAELGEVLWALA